MVLKGPPFGGPFANPLWGAYGAQSVIPFRGRGLDRKPNDADATRTGDFAPGSAESPEPPDNDAFTLMAAIQVLRRAIRATPFIEALKPHPG